MITQSTQIITQPVPVIVYACDVAGCPTPPAQQISGAPPPPGWGQMAYFDNSKAPVVVCPICQQIATNPTAIAAARKAVGL